MRTRAGAGSVVVLAVGLMAALVVGGCGSSSRGGDTAPPARDRLDVVASFYPMAEVAARVGGDRVRVTNLTPAGVEPHDLELTSRQVDHVEDADVVVHLGAGFQPAIGDAVKRRDHGAVDVLRAVGAGGRDPHFWLDPTLMAKAVDAVAGALAKASPPDAPSFRANAAAYEGELRALDHELADGLRQCQRTEIVTSHAAFGYLARRYHLTQLAISGLSPESEPGADRLASLADEIQAKGITTIFYEELVSPRVAETLARETGARAAVLSPIEGLTKQQLAAGKDYAAVMRDNLAALREALGCA